MTGSPTLATFSDGPGVPNDFNFQPAFKFTASAPGTYTIRETPIPVPEPDNFALAAFAGLALLGWRAMTHRKDLPL